MSQDDQAEQQRHYPAADHDLIRVPDLVRQRKVPPTMGWRKGVYYGTGTLVNLGKSKTERHWDALEDRIKRDIRRRYVIAVMGAGSGKTTLTAALGEVFKICRTKNVLAIDADPAFGTLGLRVAGDSVQGDIDSLLRETDVQGYPDLRPSLSVNRETGLEVLAGIRASSKNRVLSADMLDQVMNLLSRTDVHEIVFIDCGQDLDHPVMRSVLRSASMAVLVSGLTPDTSLPVARSIEWLKTSGLHQLVARSMVILNDNRGDASRDARRLLEDRFTKMTGSVVEQMPFDPFFAKGGIVDVKNEVDKKTKLRLYEIAATLADHYVPETGRSYVGPGQQ